MSWAQAETLVTECILERVTRTMLAPIRDERLWYHVLDILLRAKETKQENR